MGFLSNPKLPYFVRIAQILFAIGVLILVSYAGVHRGWWKDINGALAVAGDIQLQTSPWVSLKFWQ